MTKGGGNQASASLTSSGWLAGVQAGYNWQVAPNFVLGVVTDFDWSDINGNVSVRAKGLGSIHAGSTVDWFGTTRLNAGWATGPFMLYGTGGVAYGESGANIGIGGKSRSVSSDQVGWAAGLGVWYKVTQHVSLNTEWLYVDLGQQTLSKNIFGSGAKITQDTAFNVVKLGVNYHW